MEPWVPKKPAEILTPHRGVRGGKWLTGAYRTRSLNEVSRRQDAPMRYFKRSWLY